MATETRFFDVPALAATLPDTAETMLTDLRLLEEQAASCRIFRVYRTVPPHFHTSCNEHLYVISGRAEIAVANDPPREIGPGQLVFFKRNTVHALQILEHPFTVLAVDTPRRPPEDIHFVNPEDGTSDSFIRTQPENSSY